MTVVVEVNVVVDVGGLVVVVVVVVASPWPWVPLRNKMMAIRLTDLVMVTE